MFLCCWVEIVLLLLVGLGSEDCGWWFEGCLGLDCVKCYVDWILVGVDGSCYFIVFMIDFVVNNDIIWLSVVFLVCRESNWKCFLVVGLSFLLFDCWGVLSWFCLLWLLLLWCLLIDSFVWFVGRFL